MKLSIYTAFWNKMILQWGSSDQKFDKCTLIIIIIHGPLKSNKVHSINNLFYLTNLIFKWCNQFWTNMTLGTEYNWNVIFRGVKAPPNKPLQLVTHWANFHIGFSLIWSLKWQVLYCPESMILYKVSHEDNDDH